ncbi:MAG: TonB-dependent receptor [Spirosomataceae bacterium]
MKKIYCILTLLAWAVATALAQSPVQNAKIVGKLSGVVFDSTSNKPVEYASLSLVNVATNQPVMGAACDASGVFTLTRIAPGEYKLLVSFVGYQTKTVPNIKIVDKDEVNVGVIKLSTEVRTLNEVTVQGQKDLIEDKPDKLVYNAEKDVTNTGGTALDVMKKVPMLSVDLEGNVQLRGNENIKVLINGKPSSIFARNLAEALKAIPSDQIKQVEVITSPSAKYDAEGTAGIINIITKKQLQGLNGSVNAGVGNRFSNANGSLNYRKKKWGVSAFGWTGINYSNGYSNLLRRNFANEVEVSRLQQNSDYRNNGHNASGSLSVDYDVDSLNRFGLEMNLWAGGNTSRGQYRNLFSTGETILQRFSRNSTNTYGYGDLDANFSYTHTFKTPQKELSVLAQFSGEHNNNDYNLSQLNQTEIVDYREISYNKSRNREVTLQTDYTHPFKNKSTLEVGIKGILRTVSSNYQISSAPDGSENYQLMPERTNQFDYQQQVWSSFGSYRFSTKNKWSFSLGSRYEYTYLKADFSSTSTSFDNQYSNLIPSVSVSKDFSTKDNKRTYKIKLAYTQRIQRPYLFYLNPYVNYSDPKNLWFGNPYLNPELSHAYEGSYSTSWGSNSVNISAFWRQTNNAIERIATIDAATGVSSSTFQNIAKNSAVGLGISGNARPTTKWQLNGNLNLTYLSINSVALKTTNQGVVWRAFVNSSWQMGKGYTFQLNGSYSSPRLRLQGTSNGFYWYGLGMKKEIMKKKASLTLGMDNLFNEYNAFVNEIGSPTFTSRSESFFANRNIRLSFSWQFGQMSAGGSNRKKVSNDDKKGSE